MANKLFLSNPHTILAALESRPGDVKEVVLPSGSSRSDDWKAVERLASKVGCLGGGRSSGAGEGRGGRDRRGPKTSGKKGPWAKQTRGARTDSRDERVGAWVLPKEEFDLRTLFETADPEDTGVWLGLDSLQDPQNVGAIFRTAAFYGVRGIVLTESRSAPMSATVYDVASGGVESVPFTVVKNLQHAMDVAKEAGAWVLGTSEHAKDRLGDVGLDRKWLVLVGNEEKGLRRLTLDRSDQIVAIEKRGALGSLNVSVATGVVLSYLLG